MPNENTIKASDEIDRLLGKLWVDGDICAEQSNRIMNVVREELNWLKKWK